MRGSSGVDSFVRARTPALLRVEDGDGYALVLVSADSEKVTEVAEPAALRDMQILSVAG